MSNTTQTNLVSIGRHADAPPSMTQRLARNILFKALRDVKSGQLDIVDPGGRHTFAGADDPNLRATIVLADFGVYIDLLAGGTVGAGEAYMDGRVRSHDLPAVIRFFARNSDAMATMDSGWASIRQIGLALVSLWQRNTRRGSRRNIHAHYDLGNDLFALFLDDTMTYSSGIFDRPDASMRDASIAKLDRLCRKLRLGPEDHLLEIGTGWGSLAIHAASRYGCRVTTTTISGEQREEAVRRIDAAGLSHRVEVLQKDYRDLEGSYDKIVSIEMIEAVGHEFLPTYFGKCASLLRDDGLMAIQVITLPDDTYNEALKSVDFIKRYIFPGSQVLSLEAMANAWRERSDLRLVDQEDITLHYAETLRRWRARFLSQVSEVRRLGYPDRFIHMWDFYLAYCEGSFDEQYTGCSQLVLAKPRARYGARVSS